MMRRTWLSAVSLVCLVSALPLSAWAAAPAVDTSGPAELIRSASEVMLKDLDEAFEPPLLFLLRNLSSRKKSRLWPMMCQREKLRL